MRRAPPRLRVIVVTAVTAASLASAGAMAGGGATAHATAALAGGAWDGTSALAGVWRGARTIRVRGDCPLDGKARAGREVTLTVRDAPDGSPQGDLSFADAPEAVPQRWRGLVDGERIRFETTETMTCRGRRFDYPVRPTGTMPVRSDGGRTTMRLTAEESACGCAYDVHYELKWTAAAGATAARPGPR